MGKNNVNFAVAGFSEKEADSIASRIPGIGSREEKLSSVSAGLLRDLAGGGAMIPPEWATRIEAAIGTLEPSRIVESVEKSAGRSGDCTVVEWVVDPTQIQFYQEQADNAGVSLAHQVKAHLDYAFANGWLGSSAPDLFKILFSAEQYQYLQQYFGKDVVNGEDVLNHLSSTAPTDFNPEEENLIMDSLGGK